VDILRHTKEVSDAFTPLKTTAAGILMIINIIKLCTPLVQDDRPQWLPLTSADIHHRTSKGIIRGFHFTSRLQRSGISE
jgi:hypothetical protein